jgi:thiol:disulfide interchange protein DsbD
MAFPLYATVAFLVYVLAGQLNKDDDVLFAALGGLVLVAMALWIYGRWTQGGASGRRRTVGYVFSALFLGAGLVWGYPSPGQSEWQEWRPGVAEKLRDEGKIVYVDFTARWCATCKVNKLAVFSSQEVKQAFARQGVIQLKADWTNRDPEITRALAAFGRSAVPFNLIYVPGRADPIRLPEVLTPGIVLDALNEAAGQKPQVAGP